MHFNTVLIYPAAMTVSAHFQIIWRWYFSHKWKLKAACSFRSRKTLSSKFTITHINTTSHQTYVQVKQSTPASSLKLIQCSKVREKNFQFWKPSAVVLDTHIKCVEKVYKRTESTLVMLPLNLSGHISLTTWLNEKKCSVWFSPVSWRQVSRCHVQDSYELTENFQTIS